MLELTPQQIQALGAPEKGPPRIINPLTQQAFVLLPVDEYERLRHELYDDSPWTSEERHLLAWEAGSKIGWETADDYDELPERS